MNVKNEEVVRTLRSEHLICTASFDDSIQNINNCKYKYKHKIYKSLQYKLYCLKIEYHILYSCLKKINARNC